MIVTHDGFRLQDSHEKVYLLATLFDAVKERPTTFRRLVPNLIGLYESTVLYTTREFHRPHDSS